VLVHNSSCTHTPDEIRRSAQDLGYTQRARGVSHGQAVFKNPKTKSYVSHDIDHHSGGYWKQVVPGKREGTWNRVGTLDQFGRRIGK